MCKLKLRYEKKKSKENLSYLALGNIVLVSADVFLTETYFKNVISSFLNNDINIKI